MLKPVHPTRLPAFPPPPLRKSFSHRLDSRKWFQKYRHDFHSRASSVSRYTKNAVPQTTFLFRSSVDLLDATVRTVNPGFFFGRLCFCFCSPSFRVAGRVKIVDKVGKLVLTTCLFSLLEVLFCRETPALLKPSFLLFPLPFFFFFDRRVPSVRVEMDLRRCARYIFPCAARRL